MAADRRHAKLRELNIQYPIWVFDVDQPAWPRKLADILPGSRPAKAVGWYAWPWEYGTALERIDDPTAPNVVLNPNRKPGGPDPTAIQHLLDRLRYDDEVPLHAFDVVYESPDGDHPVGSRTRSLRDWVFEPSTDGYVAPQRVIRIERRWDAVPFWDRESADSSLFDAHDASTAVAYGVATLVQNDAELMAATGADATSERAGEKIRKVGIDLLGDATSELVEGVVIPRKDKDNDHRGLIFSRGPEYSWNKQVLRGTALENAPWSEVDEYVSSKRKSPLW